MSPFFSEQLLNVQVPFFFKGIIDTLNVEVDPTSSQGVLAIAGTVIVGCACGPSPFSGSQSRILIESRRLH